MRVAMIVSYDGTDFCGWQKQRNGRTVQSVLEGAAEQIFFAPVKITGSGRTDAGVHARGQVCHFDAETNIPAERLRECFNRILPPDVRVIKSAAAEGFDCTRNAKKKTYRYFAYFAPSDLPLYDRYSVRLGERPDPEKMRAAARFLEGEHDFKAFCASGSSAKTSVRTVYSVGIKETEERGVYRYEIAVCGNGFLYNMVRIIAGTMVSVGGGKTDACDMPDIIASRDRKRAGITAPPQGLCLKEVYY